MHAELVELRLCVILLMCYVVIRMIVVMCCGVIIVLCCVVVSAIVVVLCDVVLCLIFNARLGLMFGCNGWILEASIFFGN